MLFMKRGRKCQMRSIRLYTSLGLWFNTWWASLMAQTIKNLPAMQETQVRSLGQEDPLERGMATYSSIVAWRIL